MFVPRQGLSVFGFYFALWLSAFGFMGVFINVYAADDGYHEKNSEMNTLYGRILAQQEEMQKLIESNQMSKSESDRYANIEAVKKLHAEYLTNMARYRELKDEIRFRFPEKNDQTERHYRPLKEESIESLKAKVGLDSLLNEAKLNIERQYRIFMQEAAQARLERLKLENQSRSPATSQKTNADSKAPFALDLVIEN